MRLLFAAGLLFAVTLAWAAPSSQTKATPPVSNPARAQTPAHPISPSGAMPKDVRGSVSVVHTAPAVQPSAAASASLAPADASSPQGVGSNPSEDPAAELTRLRAEQQKAWEALNNLNPLSSDYQKGPKGAVAGTGPFEQLNKLLSQPMVQGYLRFFTHPVFSQGIDQVVNSPKRVTLLYWELGFIVFMFIFRAWRFSKSAHWMTRLWTRFWTFLMFVAGASVAIPWLVLGDPYYQMLAGAIDVLMGTKK